jgi:glycosyltransferase involved in cell wall biosynthesis
MMPVPATPAVSVVVPIYNSAATLDACLASVAGQEVAGGVELIVVDGGSHDESLAIARRHTTHVHVISPDRSAPRVFGAPVQRNHGASLASGRYIYYVDADMLLPPGLLDDCVRLCESDSYGALIVPEQSFGRGFWADVKARERDCYQGNDLVEAPRFLRTDIWRRLGGLDTQVGGGGDDWDLHIRLRGEGVPIGRTHLVVMHDEGALSLKRLVRKRFLYGTEVHRFILRHGAGRAVAHFSPFSRGYGRLLWRLRRRPRLAMGLVAMRAVEYGAGGAGMLVGIWRRKRTSS